MPYKKTVVEKICYSIGEVASIIGVNASTIRYWESRFDDLSPEKSRKGTRQFSKEDIETLRLIKYLVKDRGLTIKGALQKIGENRNEAIKNLEIVTLLQGMRDELINLSKEIDGTNNKN